MGGGCQRAERNSKEESLVRWREKIALNATSRGDSCVKVLGKQLGFQLSSCDGFGFGHAGEKSMPEWKGLVFSVKMPSHNGSKEWAIIEVYLSEKRRPPPCCSVCLLWKGHIHSVLSGRKFAYYQRRCPVLSPPKTDRAGWQCFIDHVLTNYLPQ